MIQHPNPRPISILALFLATAAPLTANPYVWTGAGSTFNIYNWSHANNWIQGVPPKTLTTDIIMAGSQGEGFGIPVTPPLVDQPWTIRSLQLSMSPGWPYNGNTNPSYPAFLEGQTITIGSGGITNSSNYYQQINNPIHIAANQSWDDGFNSNWDTPVILNGPIHFETPAIASFYELTLNGGGQLANTVGHIQIRNEITGTGRITVTDGTHLRIGGDLAAPNATTCTFRILNGGVIFLPQNIGTTFNVGTLDLQTGSTLRLYGNVHNFSASTLQGGGTISNVTGGNPAPATFRHLGNNSQTFQGIITGSPDFDKSGTGNLTLTRPLGTNTLRQLHIGAGKLILDNNTTLTATTLTGDGNLEVRTGSTFSASGNYSGIISGSGNINLGTSTLNLPGFVTHTAGALNVGTELTLSPSHFFHTGTLSGSGLIRLNTNSELRIGTASTFTGTLGNLGTLANPRGRVILAADQLLTLSGTANQHTFDQLHLGQNSELRLSNGGQLLVRAYPNTTGTLSASDDSILFLAENPDHPFHPRISAATGIVSLLGNTPLTLHAAAVTHNLKRLNLASTGLIIQGASILSVSELNGSANLRIDTGSRLNIGALQNSNFTGIIQDGTNGTGTLSVSINNGTKTLRAGGFSGTTTLTGTGTIQTPPFSAPTGPLTLGCTLEATDINNTSVTLQAQSKLKLVSIPSPAGPLYGGCITGTYTQPATSRLFVEISDRPSRPGGYSRIRATGNISLNGIIEITLNNTFNAQPGDEWVIYESTAGTITGSIAPSNIIIHATNLPAGTQLQQFGSTNTWGIRLTAPSTNPPGYYTWAAANNLTPANRSPFLDPDNDGIPNWREYLLALNPLNPSQPSTPPQELHTEAGQPIVRFRISPTADFNNDFEVQGSSDLGITDPWNSSKATLLDNGTLPDSFLYREYRFHIPSNTAPTGFLRIRYKGLTSHPND
jgi:hypothetical protein